MATKAELQAELEALRAYVKAQAKAAKLEEELASKPAETKSDDKGFFESTVDGVCDVVESVWDWFPTIKVEKGFGSE